MPFLVNLHNPGPLSDEDFFARDMKVLSLPGALDRRLDEIDVDQQFQRIYLMGCGRSGTWLLTSTFATLAGADVVFKEVAVETFGQVYTTQKALVLKRSAEAYSFIEFMPERITICYVVRHPFDVLTSHNPITHRPYHILPHRWLGEMLCLQYLLEVKRPNVTIIRYEDLAARPDATQRQLADAFGLAVADPMEKISERFTGTDDVAKSMGGLRGANTDSVFKYKNDGAKLAYLRQIRPRLGGLLDWVAKIYDYDIGL